MILVVLSLYYVLDMSLSNDRLYKSCAIYFIEMSDSKQSSLSLSDSNEIYTDTEAIVNEQLEICESMQLSTTERQIVYAQSPFYQTLERAEKIIADGGLVKGIHFLFPIAEIVFSDCIIEPQNRIENQKILKGEFYETVKAEYSSISSDIAIEDRCGDEIFLDLGILQNQCQ